MTLTLQEILDAIAAAPEDGNPADVVAALLAEREVSDPAAIVDAALEAYGEVRARESLSEDDFAALQTLAGVIDGARQHQAVIDEAIRAREEALAELDARVNPAAGDPDPAGDPDDPNGTTDRDDPDAPGGDPADPDADPEPADPPAGGGEGGTGAPAATGGELVTASGHTARRTATRRVSLGQIARPSRHAPVPAEPAGATITAAADVPGFATGSRLDFDALVRATSARMSAFPAHPIPNFQSRVGIAQIRAPFPKDLIATGAVDDQTIVDHAGDVRRLEGASLRAAGGWCAASTTIWDLCPGLESATAGTVDVPEIQVTRGGLRFTEGPDIASVWSSIGFKQTETQAIAGDLKGCYKVPCPPFREERAGVTGVCIEAGVLQNDAFPEMTRRVVELALAVHAHKVNADTIAGMEAQSTNVGTINAGISATTSVLNVIEMQIVDTRYRYRMAENDMLEMVVPLFLRSVIRSDLSLRTGVPFSQVTDAQIDGFFADRGAVPQWTYDWQDAFTTSPATGFGGATPITAWPTTVKVLMYPAGTFVRGRGEVLNLDGIYDSTNIKDNEFTRLFLEEKFMILRRCYQSRLYTIPLAVNGATGCCVPVGPDGNLAPETP